MTDEIAIAVVDDAALVRHSLAASLPGMRDAGSFATVEQLLVEAPEADLVVLDLHLVTGDQPAARQGLTAVQSVVTAGYRVCVYSQEDRRHVLAACLAAGARGVVSKSTPLAATAEAFADVAAGELVAPPALVGLLELLTRRRSLTILGPRQREVLAGRARGLSYAQLSRRLYVGESTLRGYWRDLSEQVAAHLDETTPAEIERALGLAPGDLVDLWPPLDPGGGEPS